MRLSRFWLNIRLFQTPEHSGNRRSADIEQSRSLADIPTADLQSSLYRDPLLLGIAVPSICQGRVQVARQMLDINSRGALCRAHKNALRIIPSSCRIFPSYSPA